MSHEYSDQEQPEHNPQSPSTLNIRKASSGAIKMAQEAREYPEQSEAKEQTEEEYDEQAYQSLNSAVYQLSQRQEEEEKTEQKVYEQVEDEASNHDVEKQEAQNKPDEEHIDFQARRVISYQEKKQSIVQEEILSQPEKVQAQLQQQQEENNCLYPSLMEQSAHEENTNIKDMHESPKEEQLGNEEPARDVKFSDIEARLSQELKKLDSQPEKYQEEPLIQLDDKPEAVKSKAKLQAKEKAPEPRYFKPRQYQEIQIDEAQLKMGLQSMGQAPEEPLLRIIGYQKQYFLKMQTQVYQIEYVSKAKTYIFCRKFGDFVLLNKMIKQQYPGFILYPFPENTMEFFKTLKLTVRSEKEKIMMIEQRLLELEKYINFLFQHNQLGHSQILQVFVSEQQEVFTKQFNYLQQVLTKQEEQFVASSFKQNYDNIKNIVKSGLSFFSSYISSSQGNLESSALQLEVQRKAQQMLRANLDIEAQLEKYILVCSNFQTKLKKLIQIYITSKSFRQIESSIDSVSILSTKMNASRAFFQSYQQWLDDNLLHTIIYYIHLFDQIREMIQYRNSLLERASKITDEQIRAGVALIERAQQFNNRFGPDWSDVKLKFEGEYEMLVSELRMKWGEHCGLMSKIWK